MERPEPSPTSDPAADGGGETPGKFHRFLHNLLERLQKYRERPWYLPLMAALVFVDVFIIVIPSEILLVKTVMLKPKRWILSATTFISASAAGAALLAFFARHFGEAWLQSVLGERIFETPFWNQTLEILEKYGWWGLAFIAFSPLPQQPAVALFGLAHRSIGEVFTAVWLGRAIKYYLFAYLASHSPKLVDKYLKKFA